MAEASFTGQRAGFLRRPGARAMISIASARLHDSLEQRAAAVPVSFLARRD